MNTGGLQFKKFKNVFTTKMVQPTPCPDFIKERASHIQNDENAPRSPTKQPTSFRELSGSRDKNKLFSGKKAALENKLNTLRSNDGVSAYDVVSSGKNKEDSQYGSAKKEGLFTKLLTSRSPNSAAKVLNFDDSKSSAPGANDSNSGITFSAFKDITLTEENLDCSNLKLNKVVSAGDKNEPKGLKFKGFPHKRSNVADQINKLKARTSILLTEGPLISEKGRSRSKNQKNLQILQEIKKPQPVGLVSSPKQFSAENILKPNTMPLKNRFSQAPYGVQYSISSHDPDQVIRSREGSMIFDMSPHLF